MSLLISILFIIIPIQPAVPVEQNGYVEVEAEQFVEQTNNKERTWYIIDDSKSGLTQDPDSLEYRTASGGEFVEILPDTRVTHDDELIHGTNFSNHPGLSVLKYKVRIQNPGKYYVWVRAYSTGTEDNGIHVGLNDDWPDSGQRMQWCDGKNQWTWESKQRTEENHCGEPRLIFLKINEPGIHTIMFSMREDGFAFDKFALSKKYEKPE